jgi:hypothetical protein
MKLLNVIARKSFDEIKSTLENPPYNCAVNEDGNLYIVKYNQIKSDFSNKTVQQSRGIILEKGTNKIVAHAFDKFFNYGEKHAVYINWDSAKVQEKVDGSIIKLYFYDNKWNIATNGTINAFKAGLNPLTIVDGGIDNYGDLFLQAAKNANLDFTKLEAKYTYIFELVSPYNRNVIPYTNTEIYHIGTRDMQTGFEVNKDIGVKKPKEYSFNSLDDVIAAAEKLPFSEEGYVVVDKKFQRVKVKSPAYLMVHHMRDNGNVNIDKIVGLIRKNEQSEFLSYFPEYKEDFAKVKVIYDSWIDFVNGDVFYFLNHKEDYKTRKDFASWAIKCALPDLMFKLYDGKIQNEVEYMENFMTDDKIVEALKRFKERD